MTLLFGFGLAACGGSVIGPIGDGGTGDGSSTTDGTTSGGCTGSPPSCFCGNPVCNNGKWGCTSCGDDCSSLEAQLQAEREALVKCCPTCKSLQCMGSVPDVCCPITVNGGDTTKFSALVTKYKSQCKPTCPGAPCQPVPSGICDSVNMDPQVGRCR